jgi:serine/threonine-protein kinase
MELAAYRETLRRRDAPPPSRSARPGRRSATTEIFELDSKPDNVLIGADGRPRVVDFGLARVGWMDLMSDPAASGEGEEPAPASSPDQSGERASQSSRLTLPGVISGTPGYMSPEQYRGGDVDSRSDQWSFCAALFEALYGFLPFAGESVHEHAESVHGPLRSRPLDTKVPQEVHSALRRGLRTDPDQRFPSMAELLAALAQEQRDDEAAGALSRQRFSIAYTAACALAIGIVQVRMTRNGVTHRDAILVSCLVLLAILVGGLSRRSTLLSHRFHRNVWTIMLVTSAENLLQRIFALLIDMPMPRLLPFELVVLAGNTAITAALFIPWVAFVPLIPLAAAFLAVKGYATGRLLSFVYVLVAALIGIGWKRAAQRVESREEGTGSGRARRTPSSPSYRNTPDRTGQSRPGGTHRTTPPRTTPPRTTPPRTTPPPSKPRTG